MLKEVIRETLDSKHVADTIRKELKSKLGLTNKDVSVRVDDGIAERAIKIGIKTKNALLVADKIKKIAEDKEMIDRDFKSGDILTGSNLFVMVSIDEKLKDEIIEKIKNKIKDLKPGDEKFKLGQITIDYKDPKQIFIIKDGIAKEFKDIKYIPDAIFDLIYKENNFSEFEDLLK